MERLPNVIYIGLQKTGSTFLRHYFWNHDEIYCDRHGIFFQTPAADIKARSAELVRADYAAHFKPRPPRPCHMDMYEGLGLGYVFRNRSTWDGKLFINPHETLRYGPAIPKPATLAARIKAVVPDAKILITIRNQLTWLDSNYRHYFSQLPSSRRQFIDFLATPEGKMSLDAAHFDRIVSMYDDLFGTDKVLALPLEQIEGDEETALRRLTAFLGVSWKPYDPDTKNLNTGVRLTLDDLTAPKNQTPLLVRIFRNIRPRQTELIPTEALDILSCVYAAGNVRLSMRLDTDLQQLGYPT